MKFSFEVYPVREPRDTDRFRETLSRLGALSPEMISVTYGASGSSREGSLDAVKLVSEVASSKPLAHLTCVGSDESQLREEILNFQLNGVSDFLAIRGDLPSGKQSTNGEFERADQLVELLDLLRLPGGRIGVAAFPNGHPDSHSSSQDFLALKSKYEKGADFAITQMFYDVASFLRLRDNLIGWNLPLELIPGLMPITSNRRLSRVTELSGVIPPVRLAERLNECESVADCRKIGLEFCVDQIDNLRAEGVGQIHLFAFNDYQDVTQVLRMARLV